MAGAQLRVLVVDDHALTCEGLAALLEKQVQAKSYTAYNADAALTFLNQNRVHVALVDARMPGMSGIELMYRIQQEHPQVKVIGMTSFDEDETILELLRTGIPGILLKRNTSGEEIKTCVHSVMAGKTYYTKEIWNRLNQGGYNLIKETIRFTRREFELLMLLSEGNSTKEAAEILNLKESTVEDYRKVMLKKTHCKNTAELIAFSLRNGLLYRTG